MDEDIDNLERIKIIILGESNVGKTSLASQFVNETFDSNYSPTPSYSYLPIKTVIFNDFQKQILFSITDTSGKKDKFNLSFYYKDSDVFLFVYDLTNEKSLTEIESFWYKEFQLNYFSNSIVFIVANKYDIIDKNLDLLEKGKKFASSIDSIFYKSSAKDNKNIRSLFNRIGMQYLYEKYLFNPTIRKKYYEIIDREQENETITPNKIKSASMKKSISNFIFGYSIKNDESKLEKKEKNGLKFESFLEKKFKNYIKIINGLKNEIEKHLNIEKDLKVEQSKEKSKSDELNKKIEAFISQNYFYEKEITDLKNQLKEKDIKINELKSTIISRDQVINNLNEKIKQYKQLVYNKTSNLEQELKDKIILKNKEIEDLKLKYENFSNLKNKEIEELKLNYENLLNNERNTNLKNKEIKELKLNYENLLNIEKNTNKSLNKTILDLKKDIIQKEKNINDEKSKVEKLEEKIILFKKTKPNNEKIIQLLEENKNKEKEINELKSKLPFDISKDEKLMTIIIMSSDQKMHYSFICKNTDKFNRIEGLLYDIYPEYKEVENYFLANGNKVNKFKTLEENRIKNSDIITLFEFTE